MIQELKTLPALGIAAHCPDSIASQRTAMRYTSLLKNVFIFIALSLVLASSKATINSLFSNPSDAASWRTPQAQAQLLAHAPQGVGPGKPVWLGLRIEHQPGWHTYWINPGDSGLPTDIQWQLPEGVTASEILWPAPQNIPLSDMLNYGYEGEVLLPVALNFTTQAITATGVQGELPIQAQVRWLICKVECIPQEGQLRLKLKTQGPITSHQAAFEASLGTQPKDLTRSTRVSSHWIKRGSNGVGGQHGPQSQLAGETPALRIDISDLPNAWVGQALEVRPEASRLFNHAAILPAVWQGLQLRIELPASDLRLDDPTSFPLVVGNAALGEFGRIHIKVPQPWPELALPTTNSQTSVQLTDSPLLQATTVRPRDVNGFWSALAGAFLGGLILNLMPCVFPVLAIKALHLANQNAPLTQRLSQGLAYTAGVVVSFLALGGLMLLLRETGNSIGWGFQLQSPYVISAMAGLFTLMALNLFGLFEFSHYLPSNWSSYSARNPLIDAVLSGLLAVLVASPCTAPFMGASLGLAITLPTTAALGLFAGVGLGMASPLLAAYAWPSLAHRLPRSGAWMNQFKQALAFPMLATVVWLVWVLGQQAGIDGAAALLVALLGLTLGVWGWRFSRLKRTIIAIFSVAIVVYSTSSIADFFAQNMALNASQPQTASSGDKAPLWQSWSLPLQQRLLAEGQPVFVDFTAAWCVTCQYNKKTVLADERVQALLAKHRVALLRADWTRYDSAITAELNRLGRNGIPVYALHWPQQLGQRPPRLLPELPGIRDFELALGP